jgi:hypothetical protein
VLKSLGTLARSVSNRNSYCALKALGTLAVAESDILTPFG